MQHVTLIQRLLEHWPRKLMALLGAILIWVTISTSERTQRTFPAVPVVLQHAPDGAALEAVQVSGLPAGLTIPVTLEGDAADLQNLAPDTLRVVLEASRSSESWVAHLNQQSIRLGSTLESLPEGIALAGPREVLARMGQAEAVEIPLHLNAPPMSGVPSGYETIGVFPHALALQIHGPEKWLNLIRATGVSHTLSWDALPEAMHTKMLERAREGADSMVLDVPLERIGIRLPFLTETVSPSREGVTHAQLLLVRMQPLSLGKTLPIFVQYPVDHLPQVNPITLPLLLAPPVLQPHGEPLLEGPFYIEGVSREFAQAIAPHIGIVVMAPPHLGTDALSVEAQVLAPLAAWDTYLASARRREPAVKSTLLRERFDTMMRKMRLLGPNHQELMLEAHSEHRRIRVGVQTPSSEQT